MQFRIVRPLIAARLLFAAAAFLAGPARGANYTWEVSSGDWDVPANWAPDGSPWLNTGDTANVNSGTIKANTAVQYKCRLNLNSGAILGLTIFNGTNVASNLHVNAATLRNDTAGGTPTLAGALTLDGPMTVTNSTGNNLGLDSVISGTYPITVGFTANTKSLTIRGNNTSFSGGFNLVNGILVSQHTNALGGAGSPKLVIRDGCALGSGSGWDLDQEVEIQPGGSVSLVMGQITSGEYKNLRFKGTDVNPCRMYSTAGVGITNCGAIHLDGALKILDTSSSIHIRSQISGSGSVIVTNCSSGFGYGVVLYHSNTNWTGPVSIRKSIVLVNGLSRGGLGVGAVEIRSDATLRAWNAPGDIWTNINSSISGDGKIDLKPESVSTRESLVFEGTTLHPGGTNTVSTNLLIDARNVTLGTTGIPATLHVDLAGAAAGQYDALRIDDGYDSSGDKLCLDGNVELELNFVDRFQPAGADTFVIVNNMDPPSVRTVSGRFSNDNESGQVIGPPGFKWWADVTYTGGDGNDIVLSNVHAPPPPGTVLTLR